MPVKVKHHKVMRSTKKEKTSDNNSKNAHEQKF